MKHPSILNPELDKKARYYLIYSTSNKYDVLEKSSWNDENERRKQIWMNSILIYVLETAYPPLAYRNWLSSSINGYYCCLFKSGF
jgi:hypothetical protein